MARIAAAIVLALALTGCSDARPPAHPSSPTATSAPPTMATDPFGRLVRSEQWTLDLTLRSVDGAGACDAGIGSTRTVDLGLHRGGSGEIRLYYDFLSWPDVLASLTGKDDLQGFEASGWAVEGLPCSGADLHPASTNTFLTGEFLDGRTFVGTEVRRHTSPSGAITSFHLDWRARFVRSWAIP
jgi:hypothetical protein